MFFFKHVHVNQNERVIVSKNGRFFSILTPGTHRFVKWPWVSFTIESYNLSNPVFRSRWDNYLLEKRPHIVATHFVAVTTNDSEIAMIFLDGMLYQVLLPGEQTLFWKDSASVSAEVVSVINSELPERTLSLELPEEQAVIDYFFSEP